MTPEQKEYIIDWLAADYLGSASTFREETAQEYTGSRLDPKTGKQYKSFQEILDAMPEGKFDQMMVERGTAEFLSSRRWGKKTN